ncbi:MAG TPA: hypothetical protein VGA08_00635 [Candidatus Saccharimonadales bacterium]
MAAKDKPAKAAKIWGLTRISLGLVFLWAFFDKLIGLGYATCRDPQTDTVAVNCVRSWLNGGSPTNGFLQFGTHGPLADFYQGLAGNTVVDWLFMLGLLGIGTALLFGIAMRLAAWSGALLLLMMWSSAFPPENHPVIDDHIIYALVLMGLYKADADQVWSLRGWWRKTGLVKRFPVLA